MALSGFEISVGGVLSIPVVAGLTFLGYKTWGERNLDVSKLKPKRPAPAAKPAAGDATTAQKKKTTTDSAKAAAEPNADSANAASKPKAGVKNPKVAAKDTEPAKPETASTASTPSPSKPGPDEAKQKPPEDGASTPTKDDKLE